MTDREFTIEWLRDQYALAMSITGAEWPQEVHVEHFDKVISAVIKEERASALELAADEYDGQLSWTVKDYLHRMAAQERDEV